MANTIGAADKVWGVLWNDAHWNGGECEEGDILHRPWQFVTVGILIRSDAVGVTVVTDRGEDNGVRNRHFVPRAMVVEEWEIGPARPKPRRRGRRVVEDPASPASPPRSA